MAEPALSFTRFKMGALSVTPGNPLKVRFSVANVGDREGTVVPQVYIRGRGAKRLIGWARATLKPGESRELTLAAEPRVIANWDDTRRCYQIGAGSYWVEMGNSATDVAALASVALGSASLSP